MLVIHCYQIRGRDYLAGRRAPLILMYTAGQTFDSVLRCLLRYLLSM